VEVSGWCAPSVYIRKLEPSVYRRKPEPFEYIRELEPFDVEGHHVWAFLKCARWIIVIDGVQTAGGLNGRFDDTEEFVRQYVIHQARGELGLLPVTAR
jgi:hypothetical protein